MSSVACYSTRCDHEFPGGQRCAAPKGTHHLHRGDRVKVSSGPSRYLGDQVLYVAKTGGMSSWTALSDELVEVRWYSHNEDSPTGLALGSAVIAVRELALVKRFAGYDFRRGDKVLVRYLAGRPAPVEATVVGRTVEGNLRLTWVEEIPVPPMGEGGLVPAKSGLQRFDVDYEPGDTLLDLLELVERDGARTRPRCRCGEELSFNPDAGPHRCAGQQAIPPTCPHCGEHDHPNTACDPEKYKRWYMETMRRAVHGEPRPCECRTPTEHENGACRQLPPFAPMLERAAEELTAPVREVQRRLIDQLPAETNLARAMADAYERIRGEPQRFYLSPAGMRTLRDEHEALGIPVPEWLLSSEPIVGACPACAGDEQASHVGCDVVAAPAVDLAGGRERRVLTFSLDCTELEAEAVAEKLRSFAASSLHGARANLTREYPYEGQRPRVGNVRVHLKLEFELNDPPEKP